MTKKLAIVIGLAIVIALAGCSKQQNVAATVGREKITMDEFRDALMQRFRSEDNIQRKGLDDRRQVLRQIAINDAKYQEALARKMDQRPEIQQELENSAKRKALDYLYQEKVVNAVIPESKLREFYDKSGEEVRARHILLKTTPVDTAKAVDTVQVKARIDSIKKAINNGLDFKTAAVMFSQDATSAADSGNLDWFPWGRMVDPFQEAAWNAKQGEMVGPIHTQFGYHLIKVEEKRKVPNRPKFEDQKDKIRNQLREMEGQKLNDTAREYVSNLRERRGLKYNEETLDMFRKRVEDPTVTKTIPLDPVFTEDQKKMEAATYDKGKVTVADLIEKLGSNAHRVNWDDPQTTRDLVNAIVEPKFLEEEAAKEGLVKKAMDDPDIQQQKRQAMIRALETEEVNDKIKPTEDDERNWYQNHLQNFIDPEKRTIREIFFKGDSAKAALVHAKAMKGENFAKLALKYNEKESTKSDTGRLGPYEQRQFGIIGIAAFKLDKIGDISGVERNGKNYSVIRLLDITPSRTKTFDESRAQAARELRTSLSQELQTKLEEMVLEKHPFKIKDDALARAFPMMEQPAARTDTTSKG